MECPKCKTGTLKGSYFIEEGERIDVKSCIKCGWWGTHGN